jgi:CHAD domain-containing protein
MKSSALNNYIDKNFESLVHNLSAYIKDKKPENLHRLRLDIKKIRAVYSFAEYILKIQLDSTPLKRMFLKGGKLRDVGLHIHLLNALPHPPKNLIDQLKKKESLLTQEFVNNGPRYIRLIERLRKKTAVPRIELDKKTTIHYFNREEKKADLTLKNINREGLHGYRKRMKKIHYIYHSLPEKMQNKIWVERV